MRSLALPLALASLQWTTLNYSYINGDNFQRGHYFSSIFTIRKKKYYRLYIVTKIQENSQLLGFGKLLWIFHFPTMQQWIRAKHKIRRYLGKFSTEIDEIYISIKALNQINQIKSFIRYHWIIWKKICLKWISFIKNMLKFPHNIQ